MKLTYLLGLAPLTLAGTIPTATKARAGDVLNYLQDLGRPIDWVDLGHGKLVTFPTDEWKQLEQQARSHNNISLTGMISKRAGNSYSYDCYQSGSWAYASTLLGYAGAACSAFNYNTAGSFTQVYSAANLPNEAGDPMSAVYTLQQNAAGSMSFNDCASMLHTVITSVCSGQHVDSRGGEAIKALVSKRENVERGLSWGKVTVDPQTYNCNC